jgi:hypothetical protein
VFTFFLCQERALDQVDRVGPVLPLGDQDGLLDHLPSRWGRRHRMRQSRQIRPAWPSRSSEDVLHRDSNTVVLATLRPPVDALQSGLTGRKRKVAGGERAVSESRLEDRSLNHRNSAAGLQRRLWRTSDEGSSVPSVQGRWEPVRARASYPLESKARTAAHAGRSASGE